MTARKSSIVQRATGAFACKPERDIGMAIGMIALSHPLRITVCKATSAAMQARPAPRHASKRPDWTRRLLALIIFLFVAFLVFNIVVQGIRWFWAFLGRGKPLKGAIAAGLISIETEKTVRDAELWRQANPGFWRRRKRRKTGGDEQDDADAAAAISEKPKLTWEQRREVLRADIEFRDRYLDKLHLGLYQIIIIFVIGSFLGLIIEEIWMYATAGLTEGRYGLVWGPFSPLYGTGAALLTLVCWTLRQKQAKWWVVFLVSMMVGGVLEQVTGWSMMTLFHAESWSYLHLPDHITQWVAWRFLVFWGLLGLFWARILMPTLVYAIGQPTTRRQAVFITVLATYLAADISMTLICFQRQVQRDAGVPPSNAFEQWVDTNYSDEFIQSRFENLTIDASGSSSSS